MAGIKK